MRISTIFLLIFSVALILPSTSMAEGAENQKVQEAMKSYVASSLGSDGIFPVIYKGKILKLKVRTSEKYPDGFHAGVKNHGNLFTSCADFFDPVSGNNYDIDFLVKKADENFIVTQPIVHSIDGKKNPYDLSH